jgi:20S proteasome alpha/beta subunit
MPHAYDIIREVLLGITGKDFTIIAASKAAMRGATILKASDDKTRELNSHSLMAFSGEAGDTGMLNLLYYSFFSTPTLPSHYRPQLLSSQPNLTHN